MCGDEEGRSAGQQLVLGREPTDGRAGGSVVFAAGTHDGVSTVC